MLNIFSRLSQLDDIERFKQWAMRVVENEAKMYRRKRRQHLYESIEGSDPDPAEEKPFRPDSLQIGATFRATSWSKRKCEALSGRRLTNCQTFIAKSSFFGTCSTWTSPRPRKFLGSASRR